jgi:chromosome segregation ATPase
MILYHKVKYAYSTEMYEVKKRLKDIKIEYARLFSFGKYENERIGFTCEIGEREDSKAILGDLYLNVCNIENVLQTYRFLERELIELKESVEGISNDCQRDVDEIARMKVNIDEITKLIESGKADSDQRLRHACDRQSFKDVKERLEKRQHDLAEAQKELKSTETTLENLKCRIKTGDFSLEELGIKKARYTFYAHYP